MSPALAGGFFTTELPGKHPPPDFFFFFLAAQALPYGVQAFLVVAFWFSCPVTREIFVPRPGIKPTSPALEGGV